MKSNNIISYLKLVICILSAIVSAGLMACSNIHNNGSKSSSNDLKPLIIGSDNYVPYSYLDSDGNFTGIDVEIAREACRRMGYTVLIVFNRRGINEVVRLVKLIPAMNKMRKAIPSNT